MSPFHKRLRQYIRNAIYCKSQKLLTKKDKIKDKIKAFILTSISCSNAVSPYLHWIRSIYIYLHICPRPTQGCSTLQPLAWMVACSFQRHKSKVSKTHHGLHVYKHVSPLIFYGYLSIYLRLFQQSSCQTATCYK